jgi:hypothetical protein
MPAYSILLVLFLAAASIAGMIVFLTQFRARRAVAMIAFVVTAFVVAALCASTFTGAHHVAVPLH